LTYTALVRGSSPLGYWKLNGSGSAVVGSSATISNATWSALPLVVNSASSLVVKPNGASVSINNTYNAFYKNFDSNTFTFEFWFSFNGLFNGSGYIDNLNQKYFTNNELDIITIKNGSTKIGRIYYSYLTNSFRFSIVGTGNTDAYIPIRNLNTSFYITVSYSNKKLAITLNGQNGNSGIASDVSIFTSNTSGTTFEINGNSINNSSINYVISDLAMYDYIIPSAQMRRKVLLALDADKPSDITQYIETSFFDLSEKDYHISWYENIYGNAFEVGIFDKNLLVIDDIEGILPHKINELHMTDAAWAGSAVVSSSGLKFYNENTALIFDQYGEIFEKESYQTISCQITPTTSSTSYIFSITNSINKNKSLYVTAGSAGFDLGQYDHVSSTASSLLNIPLTLSSSGTYNFALSINGEEIHVLGEDTTTSISISDLKISRSSQLIIGNLSDYFVNNTLLIKNISMNNENQNTFIGYDFTENKMLMAKLTENFAVSQILKWIRTIPLSNYGNEIAGTKVTWDGMDNCLVSISDDSDTWTPINRGSPIPGVKNNLMNKNKLIKVLVPYEYTPEKENQSFNNLNIAIYKNLSFVSEDNEYIMEAFSDNTASSSYTIKRIPQSILLRQDKFGIYFDKVNLYTASTSTEIVPGYAKINSISGSSTPYAIDFWFKADTLSGSTNKYLIDIDTYSISNFDYYNDIYSDLYETSSSLTFAQNGFLYIDGTTNKLIYSSINESKLYVNGVSYSSNSLTITPGEFYHIFYDFSSKTNTITNPSFETDTSNWGVGFSNPVPTITRDLTKYYSGIASGKITWGSGSGTNQIAGVFGSTVSGRTYTMSAYVYVPSGNQNVVLNAYFIGLGASTTLKDQWVRLSGSFVANNTYAFIGISPTASVGSPQICYVDAVMLQESTTLQNYFEGTISTAPSGSTSIYINSQYSSPSATHVHGSYGHINIWNNPINTSTASNRYNHFISKNTTTIIDTVSAKWQENWNTDAVTTVSAFKIG